MSLVITDLAKTFGTVRALDGISFAVEPGQVFGFLGANGAGKTTAMRIVLDILRADSGTVTWKGRPSTDLPRRTFGYLPEERGLYPRMKVIDQLVFFAGLYGVPRKTAENEVRAWLARFRVPEYADRRAEQLSKGNQQKIQFIAAILHDPEVLIMDEPFTGLDPVNVALLKAAFLEMRDRGKTLIFSTHQMDMAEELCDALAIIDAGRLVASGPTREVKRSTGKQVVRLATDGDPDLPWLAEIPGVAVVRPGRDYTEVEVLGTTDAETILQAALARGERVTRFEIGDPSIEQIFVERVGKSAREDVSLAGLPDAPGAARAQGQAAPGAARADGQDTPDAARAEDPEQTR
jgi:ABC-2 type transport system ATP-binding protein